MQVVVDALRLSGCVDRIIAVAPPAVAEAVTGVDEWLPAGPSGAANILAGLSVASADAPALVCLSDLPLIKATDIRAFLDGCDWDAGGNLGLISAPAFKQAFPDAPPSTFVRLRDTGPITLSGLFAVHPNVLARNAAVFDALFGARKSQWSTARVLGPGLAWRWATRQLSLEWLLGFAQTRFRCRVSIVEDAAPALAFDIDTADDYTYAHARVQ